MQTKRLAIPVTASLLCVAMLVGLVSAVNHFNLQTQPFLNPQLIQADGAPIPPLPPAKKPLIGASPLVADGAPIPPMPPPKKPLLGLPVLVADGAPIPPLPPPKKPSVEMGEPLG